MVLSCTEKTPFQLPSESPIQCHFGIYSKVIVIILSPCCDHQVRKNSAPTDGHIQLHVCFMLVAVRHRNKQPPPAHQKTVLGPWRWRQTILNTVIPLDANNSVLLEVLMCEETASVVPRQCVLIKATVEICKWCRDLFVTRHQVSEKKAKHSSLCVV